MMEWQFHSEVRAGDPSAATHKDNGNVYRIVTPEGYLCAPGFPTMGVPGKLMVLKRFAWVEPAPHVRSQPFSAEVA